MTRARYTALTTGAGIIAGAIAVCMLNAPIVPAAFGVITAVGLLLVRKPKE
jgi:hypothetical protein